MIETLLAIDREVFVFLNQSFSMPLLDGIFVLITNKLPWLGAAGIGSIWLWWQYRWYGIQFVISVALAVGVTDVINSRVLKTAFERPRPCRAVAEVRLLVQCGTGYSFPSSHAANAFCAATLLVGGIRRWKGLWWSSATLIAFSRIYCGVHYPLDVLVGAGVGIGIATVWRQLVQQQWLGCLRCSLPGTIEPSNAEVRANRER